jgi:hypothetical protein
MVVRIEGSWIQACGPLFAIETSSSVPAKSVCARTANIANEQRAGLGPRYRRAAPRREPLPTSPFVIALVTENLGWTLKKQERCVGE